MFNFFDRIKNISLSVVNIILNITTLIYLVSIFGFNHINKELIINAFTGISIAVLILAIAILAVSFVFYASFKVAYKKILSNFETFSNMINEKEKR